MARYSNEADGSYGGQCAACSAPNPHIRSQHQLTLARDFSLEALRAHLVSYGTRPAQAEDCLRWLVHLIEQYTGIPDPETGATLPWWEARQQLIQARQAIAQHCYAEAPLEYRQRYEALPPAEVPGFAHVQADAGTPFPEEEPYVPTAAEARWYDDPDGWEGREPGWNDGP